MNKVIADSEEIVAQIRALAARLTGLTDEIAAGQPDPRAETHDIE